MVDELHKRVNVLDQKNIELNIQVEYLLSENVNLKIQVSDLQDDRATKTKQISELQARFNLLTSSYFDLKKKLEEDLGAKYKTSTDEYKINLHNQAHPVAMPTVQTSRVIDRFEEDPVHAPHVAEIIRDNKLKLLKRDNSCSRGVPTKIH